MTNRCKDCARLELGLKWWFCTKDGHHIKEFDGKTYIPDPNWKGCEENFVRRDKVQYLPELYDALFDSVLRICSTCLGSNLSDIPLDDIGRYCRTNCPVHKYTALLKKVRDGK